MDFASALIVIPILIFSVILHEIAHGLAALWFGDDTAKESGRLDLNPLVHIDMFGSVPFRSASAFMLFVRSSDVRLGQASSG